MTEPRVVVAHREHLWWLLAEADAIYLVRVNEQGQIAEHWGVVDTIGTMGQLGLLRHPGQALPA